KGAEARFVYENEVQKWLDLIRGAYLETSVDDLKLGAKKTCHAVCRCTPAECVAAYTLVSPQCGFLLCDEKSIDAEAEYFLS
ncbi:hypothetical protein, partial [Dysosmobacter sp.]|uniref:hypothetical protein n=1 Tax=Dysosmobacter sp. TaxID=2591382 RepID=UPI00261E7FD3